MEVIKIDQLTKGIYKNSRFVFEVYFGDQLINSNDLASSLLTSGRVKVIFACLRIRYIL